MNTIYLDDEDLQFLVDQLFARKIILKQNNMNLEASAVEDLLAKITGED